MESGGVQQTATPREATATRLPAPLRGELRAHLAQKGRSTCDSQATRIRLYLEGSLQRGSRLAQLRQWQWTLLQQVRTLLRWRLCASSNAISLAGASHARLWLILGEPQLQGPRRLPLPVELGNARESDS